MSNAHEREVSLANTFNKAHAWLKRFGPLDLQTREGTDFTAAAQINRKGPRKGKKCITFTSFKRGGLSSRQYTYNCCWGHYYNCYGTRIGMYCMPLDWEIEQYSPNLS